MACLAMMASTLGQETPYVDAISVWNTDNPGSSIGSSNDDIEAAVNDALTKNSWNRKDIWIRPTAATVSVPLGASQVTWKIGATLQVPKQAGGRLYASGVGNPFADTVSGQQPLGQFGSTTILARENDVDLTWPVIRYIGQSWRFQGLHVRGAHDTDTQSRPEVGFLMEKDSTGLSTGWIEMRDCTFEYFDTCVQLGGDADTSNSEVNKFVNCVFDDAAIGVRIMHDQAQSHAFENCSGSADILYQVDFGGPIMIHRQLMLKTNQTLLKILDDNKVNGHYKITELDIDAQATGSVIVEIDDSARSRNNKVILDGVTDARVHTSTPTEVWAKMPGNSDLTIRNVTACGLIYVKAFTNGNRLFAPTILFDDCEFIALAHVDPRDLIRKYDGTPAEEGVDYAAVRWTNCKCGLTNQGSNEAADGELVNFFLDDYSTPQGAPQYGGPRLPRGRLAPGVLTGSAAPDDAADGFLGDLFFRTSDKTLSGPKTTTWPALASLEGPQGPAGTPGEQINVAQLLLSPLVTSAAVSGSSLTGSKILPKAGQPRQLTMNVSGHPLTAGLTIADIEARRVTITSNPNRGISGAELVLDTTNDAARFGDVDANGKYLLELKASDFGAGKLKSKVRYDVTSEVDLADGVAGNWVEQDEALWVEFAAEGARD